MRKIGVVTLALMGLFMVGAMTAGSALATTPQILAGGKTITELLFFQISGELLLEDTKSSVLGNPDLLCSGIFDGMIEPGGALGFIEELLMLSGELLNELGVLNGAGNDMIDCTDHNNLCSSGGAEKVLLTVLLLEMRMTARVATPGQMTNRSNREPRRKPKRIIKRHA
jgi:hypothetical protein